MKVKVYELGLRIFHWLFAGLILFSLIVAKRVDDQSIIYTLHMISGLLVGAIVLWRLWWCLFGQKYSKFSSFALNLKDLFDYFLGILKGTKRIWTGHNPASSWGSILMFICAIGLSLSGILMTLGGKEDFEDAHENLADFFIILIVAHILGLIFHSFKYRDGIIFSMISGKKNILPNNDGYQIENTEVKSDRNGAMGFLVFVLICVFILFMGFNQKERTFSFLGKTLQLGEPEEEFE